MHTDDHILETLVAAKGPLPSIAAELAMPFIALVKWMDAHADLIAIAKRAIKSHLKLLTLRAEVVALADLTHVSASTADEERKRKSASQLLRHTAKRLLTNPGRKPGAPCASVRADNPAKERALPPSARSSTTPNIESQMPIAAASCAGPSSPKPTIAQRLAARRLAALDASRPIHS